MFKFANILKDSTYFYLHYFICFEQQMGIAPIQFHMVIIKLIKS